MPGNFIISLDFELFWGVSENKTIQDYGSNILKAHGVVEETLAIFKEFNIEATWAVVGLICFKDFETLRKFVATNQIKKIGYRKKCLDNLSLFDSLEKEDKNLFFALDLVRRIVGARGQELASHTFSHLYSLEHGITRSDFDKDVVAMISLFESLGARLNSIIFPRNQSSSEFIDVLSCSNINCIRGNQNSFIYKESVNQHFIKRFLRLLDSYINITGFNPSNAKEKKGVLDIPASRFLRPYSQKLRVFESLRLARIKREMCFAASNGLNYHLWWHPHNFGSYTSENFSFLRKILVYQRELENSLNFRSRNMKNIYNSHS